MAWSGGATFNIVNICPNAPRCFDLGRQCTGNRNAKVTYYNPAARSMMQLLAMGAVCPNM